MTPLPSSSRCGKYFKCGGVMSDVMLIGSRALNFWFGSDHRQPIDFDFFIKVGIFKKRYRENRGDLTFYK